MATGSIAPPALASLLAPILPALPAATVSAQPAIGILPLLSPILRQRVQLLSSSSTEPWLRLLCYDISKIPKLGEVVRGGGLEPHPVSGEVEVDWAYDAETRYRRVDLETLQALVILSELGLAFRLVYCVGDTEGGGDGWRVGEVTVADKSSPFAQFEGFSTIEEAEGQFQQGHAQKKEPSAPTVNAPTLTVMDNDEDDDDDGYWARYDATPARTPANNRSPAPQTGGAATQSGAYYQNQASTDNNNDDDDDDDYFAQYDQVQPAMDNHDPDEEAQQAHLNPPLGLGRTNPAQEATAQTEPNETKGSWTFAEIDKTSSKDDTRSTEEASILHPRPESSASSSGSQTVAKLEASAGKQEQNEFSVKQHVSRSIRSLYMLSRASGIEREEFEQLVKMELEVLGMVED